MLPRAGAKLVVGEEDEDEDEDEGDEVGECRLGIDGVGYCGNWDDDVGTGCGYAEANTPPAPPVT